MIGIIAWEMFYKGGLKMHKYTRKYYINGVETSLETTMKYLEIMLTHGVDDIGTLGISFKDVICDMDK